MINHFFIVLFRIFNFFPNGISNMTVNVYNINSIAQINFTIMSHFQNLNIFICRNNIIWKIYTLKNIEFLLRFKIICNTFHFICKSHTSANSNCFHCNSSKIFCNLSIT